MTVFSSSAAVAYHDGLLSRASSAPPASRFDGEEISNDMQVTLRRPNRLSEHNPLLYPLGV